MRAWLRCWLGIESRRGTLTFLPTGFIIGLPPETTKAEADRVSRSVSRFLATGGPVVFPWPVDVIDKRDKP